MGNAAEFLNYATFNEAHWLFAFNYWALSWRVELIQQKLPPDIYNTRLNTVNIIVSVITILIPAIDWVFVSSTKVYVILGYAENLSLVLSCIILVWGFKRLIKILASPTDHTVN